MMVLRFDVSGVGYLIGGSADWEYRFEMGNMY
jgi:hypothetical protein